MDFLMTFIPQTTTVSEDANRMVSLAGQNIGASSDISWTGMSNIGMTQGSP